MKILRIMSIVIVSMACQSWAMEEPIEVKPISTMEWLFGYRTYTPGEQQIVDFFAQLELEAPDSIEYWFKEHYRDINDRVKIANIFIKFIEIKSLKSTFPKIYEAAQYIKRIAENAGKYKPLKPLVLTPVSRENIEKGLVPGISFKS